MSHAATKWAFDQPEAFRDMKPAEWSVLVVLADCHNPVNGCFPSQDYIATRINLSERAVRDHLIRLRERKLVNWEGSRDDGKRGSNRYQLAFEPDFQPAESAGSSEDGSTGKNTPEQPAESDESNRQNLPPNPVREPVIEPVKVEREGAREAPKKPDPKPPESKPEDDQAFQKLLKRYPGTNSPNLAFPPWLRLDDEGRRRSLARLEAYLAELRKVRRDSPYSLQRYLSERLFDQVDEPADGNAPLTTVAPRSREYWWFVAQGRVSKFMFDLTRNQGTPLTVRVSELPTADELKTLVSIESGSPAFEAWAKHLAEKQFLRMRSDDTHLCGKFIYVPSEYPPGYVHDPPEDHDRERESERMEREGRA